MFACLNYGDIVTVGENSGLLQSYTKWWVLKEHCQLTMWRYMWGNMWCFSVSTAVLHHWYTATDVARKREEELF